MSEDASLPTIKDVYGIVSETRAELSGQISGLGAQLSDFVRTSEHRLTVVETHQAAHSAQMTDVVARLDEHGRDIGHLKDRQSSDEAATKALEDAHDRRRDWRRWAIGTLSAAVAALGASLLLVYVH